MLFAKLIDHFCTGNRSVTSGCAPGWHNANQACFLFDFQIAATWSNARSFCHKLDADLALINDTMTMDVLANQRNQMSFSNWELFLGLSSQLYWVWSDGTNVQNTSNLENRAGMGCVVRS